MKRYIKLLVISIVIMFSGCDNDLTEKVFSEITESEYDYTEDDAYSVIGAVYTNMRSFMGFYDYFTQEICSDEMVQPANASGWDDGGVFRRMHLHSWNSEQGHVSVMWNMCYKGILHANRIIDQFESGTVPAPENLSKETLISEMRVARAFYYWYLIDNYGDVPLVVEITQDIPSVTPRAEVYQFIVDEIIQSIPNLSEKSDASMYARFNKWAAKTLLANVYLNSEVYIGQSKWNECISECNDVISSGKYILEPNYKDVFKTHNEGSKEIIFAIPFDEINAGGFYMHHITLHASSKATFGLLTTPWGAGSAKAVPQFIDIYDPEDVRLADTWIMGPQFEADGVTPILGAYEKQGEPIVYSKEMKDGIYTAEDAGYRIGKYEIEKGANFNRSNDLPYFRYAQILMMKAECLLRTGKGDEAAQIVTNVRQRAFLDNPAKATITGSELEEDTKYQYGYVEDFEIVDKGNTDPVQFGRFLDELGCEFACEMYRRRDMIRFGTFIKKSWLSHKPNGVYRSLFPIPQSAIDANPNLVQNPNYE